MAKSATDLVPLTGSAILDVTLMGPHWDTSNGTVLSWTLGAFKPYTWSPAWVSTIQNLLNSISSFSNIQFKYIPQGGMSTDLSIVYDNDGAFFNGDAAIVARAVFPYAPYEDAFLDYFNLNRSLYPSPGGDVFINGLSKYSSSFNISGTQSLGSQNIFILLHEIGHALGLKHPHNRGFSGQPTFSDIGWTSKILDKDWFTVMSYNDDFPSTNTAYDPATMMPFDVAALQYLYGANLSTNAGDTTHRIVQDKSYKTIWDASGTDTVSTDQWTTAAYINLEDIPASNGVSTIGEVLPLTEYQKLQSKALVGSPTSISWLYGKFENVVGSNYGDQIVGTSSKNVITGGRGDDVIDGGGGLDTGVLNYSFMTGATGMSHDRQSHVVIIKGVEGVDAFKDVERLKFTDTTIAFDIDGNAGQAYRLYQAAFDRKPDNAGLKYWIQKLDDGVSLNTVSAAFQASTEFKGKYGANPTSDKLITAMYSNVLHRVPDQAGNDYWKGQLSSGAVTKDSLLVNFSESNENQVNVIGVIQNGIELT